MLIDWANPDALVSQYITVHKCLWLPTWNRMAGMMDGLVDPVKNNLIRISHKLDAVQAILGCPLTVHSFYRPMEYNTLIGGAPGSYHTKGAACDFSVNELKIENIKEILLPLLEGLEMRMEKGTPTWVHLDIGVPTNGIRYFNP